MQKTSHHQRLLWKYPKARALHPAVGTGDLGKVVELKGGYNLRQGEIFLSKEPLCPTQWVHVSYSHYERAIEIVSGQLAEKIQWTSVP